MRTTAKIFIPKRMVSLLLALLMMLGLFGALPQVNATSIVTPGTIGTVAGIGLSGYSGNGALATSAKLNSPYGVAFDAGGNLYIADTSNNVIRKVDANTGIISTVAGKASVGYSGDGGLATNAMLNCPESISFGTGGNLYIADSGNHRIRKVDMNTGIISTVVGTGAGGYSGNGGLAINATMLFPFCVIVDAVGNLYFTDTGNNCIRKVDVNTGIISTIAGNFMGGFSGDGGLAINAKFINPETIALDAAGNLYIADYFNNRIRKIDFNTGIISTVVGMGTNGFGGDNGLAVNAQLSGPTGIAFDALGNLYFSDTSNNRIRRVDVKTGIISTVGGNGVKGYSGDNVIATSTQLSAPMGIAFDSMGDLFIADRGNNRIRSVANINGCMVSFNSNGGTDVNSIIANNGTTINAPITPTKAGYILTGWYKDAALTTSWNFATDVITSNITLYAGWTPGFTVTFNSNGGSAVLSVSVKTSSTLTEPTAPTMTGYTFLGWFTSQTSFVKAAFPCTVKSNITLYARWLVNSYMVTFKSNGGTCVATPKIAKYNTTITAPVVPTGTGYTFNGWYTLPTGGTMITFPYTVTNNVTLYGKWTKNKCTVTFINDGNVVSTVTTDYNMGVLASTALTKTGYTFSGWYTSAGLKMPFLFAVKCDITLYAGWKINSYKVTFNSNGGTAVAQKIANYNTTITAPPAPTKAGYKFNGWFTAATGGTKITFPYTVTTNTIMYAQWTK